MNAATKLLLLASLACVSCHFKFPHHAISDGGTPDRPQPDSRPQDSRADDDAPAPPLCSVASGVQKLTIRLSLGGVISASCQSESLKNFILPILISDVELQEQRGDGAPSRSNLSTFNLRFTDSSDVPLDYEAESYAAAKLLAWVRIPQLALNGSFEILFHCGGKDAYSSTSAPEALWGGGDYLGVWHLGEHSTEYFNSVPGGTAGVGTGTAHAPGQLGEGQGFAPPQSHIVIENSFSQLASTATLSAWVLPTKKDNAGPLVAEMLSIGNRIGIRLNRGEVGTQGFYQFLGGLTQLNWNTTSSQRWLDATWHQVVYILRQSGTAPDGPVQYVYIDGALAGTSFHPEPVYPSAVDPPRTVIGKHASLTDDATLDFSGTVDEVRILKPTLTACRIEAEYWTQKEVCGQSQGICTVTR